MLFGIFIFLRNDSLLLIREIFRSDASTAGLVHVCDWSDAAHSFHFMCMCSPLFGKLWICLSRLAQSAVSSLPDDSGDKLQQSGIENELLNRFTDQVEENRGAC